MFIRNKYRERERGQSITELAIMLPVLLIIVAGTLEVTNLLTTYNRVQLVAREGARFGGGGGTNDAIGERSFYSSPDPLEVDYEDVYVVRPVVNSSGTGWVEGTWSEVLVYDGSVGVAEGSGLSADDVFADLLAGAAGPNYLTDMELVVVVVNYNADTVLGLSILPGYENRVPLQAYGAMPLQSEVAEPEPTEGCFFFPLGCHFEDVSDIVGVSDLDDIPVDTIIDLPAYGSGNYGGCDFMVCDVGPGNSDAAEAMRTGCSAEDGGTGDLYLDPDPRPGTDSDEEPDYAPSIGDHVWGVDEGAAGHGVWNALMRHCDTVGGSNSCPEDPDTMRIFIYDEVLPWDDNQPGGPQADQIYRIERFALIQIVGVDYDGSYPTMIHVRFLGWDDSCGQ